MPRPVLYFESNSQLQAWEALTGDTARVVYSSANKPWSGATYTPKVRPYGLVTGGVVTPTDGQNDKVDVAALTAYMAGNAGADADGLVTVAASAGETIARATATDTHKISSITVNDSGAIAIVAGADHTAFSETRGADGGPPLIPVGSVEVAQVRLSSNSAGPITAAEIFQSPGLHQERADYPGWAEDTAGGKVTFDSALPLVHTGPAAKKVYARVATPIYARLRTVTGFTPAEATQSVTSTDTFDGPVGTVSSGVGQASFTVQQMADGVNDPVMAAVGKQVWLKFQPDENKAANILSQGYLAVGRTYGSTGNVTGNFTLSAQQKSVEKAS